MNTEIYLCSGCRIVTADGDDPAPCVVMVHNGELPGRCVCGRGAETDWRLLTRVGLYGESGDE